MVFLQVPAIIKLPESSPGMKKRLLGKTDLQVSVLCLGTMTWGEQNTEAQAHAQLDRALEAGINFIDTAEVYPVPIKQDTTHRTESYIGSWIKARGNRSEFILASKVAGPAPDRITWLRDGKHRLDRKNIMAAVESSLQRLQTDYLDLYQLHWPERSVNIFGQREYAHNPADPPFDLQETLTVMSELVQSGKVRHVGLSNETAWGTMRYVELSDRLGLARPVSIQNCYNLLNRTYEISLSEVSIREQVGLLAYSPLAAGLLSGKYLGGQKPAGSRGALFGDYFSRYQTTLAENSVAQYATLAKELGITPSQLALAFVTGQNFVTSAIIGATSLEQLNDNLGAADITLSKETLTQIQAIHNQQPNPCP